MVALRDSMDYSNVGMTSIELITLHMQYTTITSFYLVLPSSLTLCFRLSALDPLQLSLIALDRIRFACISIAVAVSCLGHHHSRSRGRRWQHATHGKTKAQILDESNKSANPAFKRIHHSVFDALRSWASHSRGLTFISALRHPLRVDIRILEAVVGAVVVGSTNVLAVSAGLSPAIVPAAGAKSVRLVLVHG